MRTLRFYFYPTGIIFLLSFALLFASCKKDELIPEHEDYYTEMKYWYYWSELIPQIEPSTYPTLGHVLEAIRYRELDRWSFIADWDEINAYFSNSEFIGYGFSSKFDAQGNLRVSLVFNSVELYQKGVRRSWIVQSVNGTIVTPGSNITSLLGPDQVGVTNTFVFLKPDGETEEISVSKQVIVMNTVLHYEVIPLQHLKVGYMVLNSFTGTSSKEIKEVFEYFAQQDVDEFILDLRYNTGGLTSVAVELASLIGGPELVGEPFAKSEYNSKRSQYNQTDVFTSQDNMLSMNRLVTICTGSTASASEMIINGLRPYIDVYVVGAKTYGKPMGANVFQFKEKWANVPITFKTKNANDEGDYFDGIAVDLPAPDGLDKPFGDPQEASLEIALAFLLTGSTKTQPVLPVPYPQPMDYHKWGLRKMIGAH
jgi:carboxyl-terminal processing protease